MDLATLNQLDRQIAQLSLDEQLWLIERIARRLRESPVPDDEALQKELAAMAADPDIQRELRQIEEGFRGAQEE
jgi:hypothetical protein